MKAELQEGEDERQDVKVKARTNAEILSLVVPTSRLCKKETELTAKTQRREDSREENTKRIVHALKTYAT
jgi:hypothetical protein